MRIRNASSLTNEERTNHRLRLNAIPSSDSVDILHSSSTVLGFYSSDDSRASAGRSSFKDVSAFERLGSARLFLEGLGGTKVDILLEVVHRPAVEPVCMKMVPERISSGKGEGVGSVRERGEVEESLVGDPRKANGMTGIRALYPVFPEAVPTASEGRKKTISDQERARRVSLSLRRSSAIRSSSFALGSSLTASESNTSMMGVKKREGLQDDAGVADAKER